MKVISLNIKHCKRYRSNSVRELEMEFPSPVQIITGVNGSSKALVHGTPVRVPGGWKNIEDLRVGDEVINVNGTPSKVTGTYYHGELPVFTMQFIDGRTIEVNGDHLWTVYRFKNFRDGFKTARLVCETVSTNELFNKCRQTDYFLKDIRIPVCIPEKLPKKDLPVDPYVLGVFLGDGYIGRRGIRLDTDKWIIDKIESKCGQGFVTQIRKRYEIERGSWCANISGKMLLPTSGMTLADTLKDLNLLGTHSHTKFIPEIYMEASISQKIELLRGLFDTDGHVADKSPGRNGILRKAGTIYYCTTSKQLADGVRQLVWSLGGLCSMMAFIPVFTYRGERRVGKTAYKLAIRYRYPNLLMSLPRKQDRLQPTTQYTETFSLPIRYIVPSVGMKKCTCISIDHPSGLFVTKDYLVTHNSSTLQELCPLPPVRSAYESDGYKKVCYLHNGHEYELTSDFSNRTSPHSFQIDGKELNTSGTTEVQTELVEQHFGFTPAIRNLVYNKVNLCSTTRAERKNLFLNLNPMDLGLILDTHKKTQSRLKDLKANLKHLYTRRSEIEAKLLKPELLEQHVQTKQKLSEDLLAIDKLISSLDQHITQLGAQYHDDLKYYIDRQTHNTPLIPIKQILSDCRQVLLRTRDYSSLDRDTFQSQFEKCKLQRTALEGEKASLVSSIMSLTKEIDEYAKHFEKSNIRSVSTIEKEIKELDEEMKKYSDLPESPIPKDNILLKKDILSRVKSHVAEFTDMRGKLIPEKDYEQMKNTKKDLENELTLLTQQISTLDKTITDGSQEIERHSQKASVPADCTSNTCGLRQLLVQRVANVKKIVEDATKRKESFQKEYDKKKKEYDKIVETLTPYEETRIYFTYRSLLALLQREFPIEDWQETLLDRLNTQPFFVLTQVAEYVNQSEQYYEYQELAQKKQLLSKELETVIKTVGVSSDFLKAKMEEKEAELQKQMAQVSSLDKQLSAVASLYLLCQGYTTDCAKIKEYEDLVSRGTRALIIENAIKYWTRLKEYFTEARAVFSEELRKIETIVREQTLLKNTFENEILSHIEKYTKERALYEKIEMGLSPTTGLPHKSMVRYLNALINNVNFFISQVWSYKLKILPLDENQPIDYAFKIEVGSTTANDISELSDGQTEIVNFAWVLAILLQLKLLDKIPFFADELGRALDANHRNALLKFLGQLVDNKLIEQLFLVNHYAVFTDGFRDADIICLSPESMSDLPGNVNEHVRRV